MVPGHCASCCFQLTYTTCSTYESAQGKEIHLCWWQFTIEIKKKRVQMLTLWCKKKTWYIWSNQAFVKDYKDLEPAESIGKKNTFAFALEDLQITTSSRSLGRDTVLSFRHDE